MLPHLRYWNSCRNVPAYSRLHTRLSFLLSFCVSQIPNPNNIYKYPGDIPPSPSWLCGETQKDGSVPWTPVSTTVTITCGSCTSAATPAPSPQAAVVTTKTPVATPTCTGSYDTGVTITGLPVPGLNICYSYAGDDANPQRPYYFTGQHVLYDYGEKPSNGTTLYNWAVGGQYSVSTFLSKRFYFVWPHCFALICLL